MVIGFKIVSNLKSQIWFRNYSVSHKAVLCGPTTYARSYSINTTVMTAGSSKARLSKYGPTRRKLHLYRPSLVTLTVVATTLLPQAQTEIQFDPRINNTRIIPGFINNNHHIIFTRLNNCN